MINLDDMKKRLREDLAREADQEPNQADARKTKENSIDDTINIPELNTGNIEEYINTCPIDEKGNHIIDDQIFDQYYKILPAKCVNKSRSWRTTPTGGKIKIFGADPEEDKQIQKKGAEALNAALAHRRTMAEDIQIMLAKKATPETVEALGLTADANNQEAIIAAALLQAIDGNIKAQQFIRDTIGEQPTIKQEVDIMTDDDRKLLANISDRLT